MSSVDGSGLTWIDAHHHLWDLALIRYPWLLARGEERFFGQPDPIRKDYLLQDFLADTNGLINSSVHVQVGAAKEHELLETEFVDSCSTLSDGLFPSAAVVAVDLGQREINKDLENHLAYPVTRGVRHMIGKSPEENPGLPPFVPDTWIRNWRVVAHAGLSFDLQLTEDQYPTVLAALEQVPELKVAICHLASPWDRSEEGFQHWKTWMKLFAGLSGAVMKISGFSMFTQCWDEPQFMKWAEASLEIFGADRCMLGSNFPVDSLYVNYGQLFQAWQKLAGQCSQGDAISLSGGTASGFYRI